MSEKKDDVASQEMVSKSDPEFVKKEAYEEVSKDMHKFKSKLREAEAAKVEYAAKLKAIEEEGMREKQQYKELYEKLSAELEQERQVSASKEKAINDAAKRSALKQELGSVKDPYLNFANLDAIELDEYGAVDNESLHRVANDFRKNHGELIPKKADNTITQHAAPTDSVPSLGDKTLEQMTLNEKIDLYKRTFKV